MMQRVPSVRKQRRRTPRPRITTLPTGCRWPAISRRPPARLVAQGEAAERHLARRPRRRCSRQGAVVIAGDPDPLRALPARRASAARSSSPSRSGPPMSWKLSPRAIDRRGREARDRVGQRAQGLAGVVGRQHHAPRAKDEPFSKCRSATRSASAPADRARPQVEHGSGDASAEVAISLPSCLSCSLRARWPVTPGPRRGEPASASARISSAPSP